MKNNNVKTGVAAPSASPDQGVAGDLLPPNATNEAKSDHSDEAPVVGSLSEVAVALLAAGDQGSNVFNFTGKIIRKEATDKLATLQTIGQRLSQVADLYAEGAGKEAEANEIAADAAFGLYKARCAGTVDGEEITSLLRDKFGAKMKGAGNGTTRVSATDPNASATPFGPGEAIRKRVVRAVSAAEFASGKDGGRFFEGLSPEDVEEVVSQVNSGGLSIWSAYDKLATMKRDNMVKTIPAFDPRKIAAIVEELGKPHAPAALVGNPGLIDAYDALIGMLRAVGGEVARLQADKDAKASKAA